MIKRCFFLACLIATATLSKAQQTTAPTDSSATDSLLNSLTADEKPQPVIATFKSTRLILSETSETIKKNNLNFMVIHRFGDIGGANGGGKTLWGLDNSSDIYIGFEYGLTDNLDIDFGRSKYEQLLELGLKYNILHQTTDNSMPVAVTVVGKTGLKPYEVSTKVFDDYTNRLNYFAQIIFARKFSSALSVQVSPSFVRNNLPFPYMAGNRQGFFALSAAGRLKFSKRMGIVLDYAHPFSSYRDKSTSPKFYDPSGVGLEIETGGHVFTINFTNAQAISPMNYLSDTESKWTKGQYRLGFAITRVFDFNRKHKGTYK
ncbi:hypothetical protein KHS38_20490 [Mucilaginibacter sp. Bleaf8]|uniref:DUF5777 family beta-barrel protein n=1 Tax=Mucilaginibacter sp. Bleaf8 TaxID=2834430 RepID=UPI001BD0A76A|nr:DUF5777 family beta-barrel protein [Mucilaginibacter sp. Bleaf8]MBS7566796.1 hypothetical protein [Mucilaginibacter sp. Bleaf8]